MADCIIKNDVGLILLNDGTSCILLNEQVPGGVTIEGTHATQLIAPRAARLDFVEFTFWIKAGIIFQIAGQTRIISSLIRESILSLKIKSPLLIETQFPHKLKSTLITNIRKTKISLEAYLLTKTFSLFVLGSKTTHEKLKKVFLRKLLEDIDKDDG